MKIRLACCVLSGMFCVRVGHAMTRQEIVLQHLNDQSVLKPLMLKKDSKTLPLYNCFLAKIYQPSKDECSKIEQTWESGKSITNSEVLSLTRNVQYKSITLPLYAYYGIAAEMLIRNHFGIEQGVCTLIMKEAYDAEEIARECQYLFIALNNLEKERDKVQKKLDELGGTLSSEDESSEEDSREQEEVKEEK